MAILDEKDINALNALLHFAAYRVKQLPRTQQAQWRAIVVKAQKAVRKVVLANRAPTPETPTLCA